MTCLDDNHDNFGTYYKSKNNKIRNFEKVLFQIRYKKKFKTSYLKKYFKKYKLLVGDRKNNTIFNYYKVKTIY